jgi:uncharacterized GH25 family protein
MLSSVRTVEVTPAASFMKNQAHRIAQIRFGIPFRSATLRLFATLCLLGASAAQAHEFWLLPQSFSLSPTQPFQLELRVGAGWPGESLGRNPAYIERFGLVDAGGTERHVGGQPGRDPAGVVVVNKPGTAWAVFRSKHSAITLEAAKFESYLRDEGLERIIDARRLNGTSDAPAREMYSRCAKAFLQVGPGSKTPLALLKRNTGLTLELIPQTDPQQLRGGGAFTVQLLYLNQPLRGALVKALPQTAQGEMTAPQITGRTDGQGRVTLPLSHGGVWLINAVHMVAAAPQLNADWESVWSSLTFELPPAQPGAGTLPVFR